MTRTEFLALRDLPDKRIEGDISFAENVHTSPVLTFENVRVENSLGLDVRLNGKYNAIAGSFVFNFRVRAVGPICRLEVNSTMHAGSRTHKHALFYEDDPRQNLPVNVKPRPELEGMSAAAVWRLLCREAKIKHSGIFYDPETGAKA